MIKNDNIVVQNRKSRNNAYYILLKGISQSSWANSLDMGPSRRVETQGIGIIDNKLSGEQEITLLRPYKKAEDLVQIYWGLKIGIPEIIYKR